MGESSPAACAQPSPTSTHCDQDQGDPLRCLTSSVSLGRFMTESLDWEKWSCFTRNRRLEEAEKYFKPGFVAQKKAYFEAVYKRTPAKKSAALFEEENEAANNSFKQSFHHEIPNDSSLDVELKVSTTHMAIDEKQGLEETHVSELDCSITELEGAELVIEQDVSIVNPIKEEKQPAKVKDAEKKRNLVTSGNKRSFSKSIDREPSKRRALANLTIPAPSRKEDSYTPNTKKTVRISMEKKRLDPKSLHMSINFAPRASETVKTSPILQKNRNSEIVINTVKASRDNVIQRTSIRSSANLSKTSTSISELENKNSRRLRNPVLSGTKKVDGKSCPPSTEKLCGSHSESSSACGRRTRFPLILSPFTLRSEERAAKRKEFFQKLEVKHKNMEAEKVQLQARPKVTEKKRDLASSSNKTVRISMEEKRPAPKSLSMSIDFAPRPSETVKTSSPILRKIGDSALVKTIVTASKDNLIPQTSTRSFVNVSKNSTLTLQRENKRSRTLLNPALSGIRTVNGKSHPLSTNCPESSSTCGRKTRSPLVSSSYALRSEERAEKRKEFFQKVEDKRNNEAKNVQMQAKSKPGLPKHGQKTLKKIMHENSSPNILH